MCSPTVCILLLTEYAFPGTDAHGKSLEELAAVKARLGDLAQLPDEMTQLKKRYEVASQALKDAQTQRNDAQYRLEGTSARMESVQQELKEAVDTHAHEMDTKTAMTEAAKAALTQAEQHHLGACSWQWAL